MDNKRRTILRTIIYLIVTFYSVDSYAQNLKGIKSISRLEEDSVVDFRLFDTSGNLIYRKDYEEYSRWRVIVRYYNSQNKIIRSISGHTALGYTIWDYSYDSLGNEINSYYYEELYDYQKVRITHPYIRNYNSIQDLERDSFIINMNNLQRRHKFSGKGYDQANNLTTDTTFDEDGINNEIEFHKYDSNGNLIETFYNNSVSKIFYIYNSQSNKTVKININDAGDTISVNKYKYDRDNQIISDSTIYYGRLSSLSSEAKHYYRKGKLIKTHLFESNVLTLENRYEYDQRGNKVKLVMTDYKHKSKRTTIYKYEFY